MLVLLASCVALVHVAPEPRSVVDAARAAVRVEVTCSQADPFAGGDPAGPPLEPIVWRAPSIGAGVLISERHVLTAEHVVRCPSTPHVTVQLIDGRRFAMVVARQDVDGDVARLELASAERFGLQIAPPTVAAQTFGRATAEVYGRGAIGGELAQGGVVAGMTSRAGDSGAGVYSAAGELLGIVVASGVGYTRFAAVSIDWMEGT